MKIKRILFPTDFSACAAQAMIQAIYLAESYQAELHVMHAIASYDPAAYFETGSRPSPQYNELQQAAAERMDRELAMVEAGDLKIIKSQWPAISVSSQILDYAIDYQIDLIVMGTHGRRWIKHLLLGSVAEQIVRYSPCPVLTVRELAEAKLVDPYSHILVPIDFSPYSRTALSYAKQIAHDTKARVDLLHVIEKPRFAAVYPIDMPSYNRHEHNLVSKLMSELVSFLNETPGPDVLADIFIQSGSVTTEISNFVASKGVDLVVIATHGLTGLEHLLLGSITEKVVRHSACPVFTVKPFGRSLIESKVEVEKPVSV